MHGFGSAAPPATPSYVLQLLPIQLFQFMTDVAITKCTTAAIFLPSALALCGHFLLSLRRHTPTHYCTLPSGMLEEYDILCLIPRGTKREQKGNDGTSYVRIRTRAFQILREKNRNRTTVS